MSQEKDPSLPMHFEHLVSSVEEYAIFTMSRSGLVLDWNRGAQRIKQYQADEIIGHNFSCFYPEADVAEGLPGRELEIAQTEGKFIDEGWRLRKDGSRFWASVTITAVFSPDGGRFERFVKITRDLTERMMAEEALRQSEERFRLLLESVTDYAIFMLDPEGHVMSWNAGARKLKGYEQQDILGKHFSIFYPQDSRDGQSSALLSQALNEGRAESEGWRVRKDGSRFWGNVIITAVRDSGGILRGFAKTTRDLTERRNMEALQENDKRKDAFLATLAHELRNPIAPILFGMDVVVKNPNDPKLISEIAPMLHRQVDQMARLIDDLMDMSRVNTGVVVLKKTLVALSDVVRSAVEATAPGVEKAKHHMSVLIPDRPVMIEADPHRLTQIIANLISNSVKFTPPGGRIVLEVGATSRKNVRIIVTDNGQGISPELQGKVFEMFEQGRIGAGGGLGIGLTLVKALAELHGGNVSVTSAGVGCGSEFQVILPVLSGGDESSGRSRAKPRGDRSERRFRVLIADDGKSTADILGMFLEMEGMEAKVTYDGIQAVEAARDFNPDMVCLDLGMPGMNGFEAAKRIRMINKDAVIIALSGWGGEEDRRRSAEAGFDDHLVKPVTPEIMREVLDQFLR